MATSQPLNMDSQSIQRTTRSSKSEAHMNAINNNVLRMSPRRQASLFAEWFRNLVDSDRSSLSLYLSNDAVMQWFGRTIKTRKKISGFLKYDMHFTNHRFTSIEACDPISVRGEEIQKKIVCDDDELAVPLEGVTPPCHNFNLRKVTPPRGTTTKKRRAFSSSPESPTFNFIKRSRMTQSPHDGDDNKKYDKVSPIHENAAVKRTGNKPKKVEDVITVLEEGQGDCLPSTSGTKKALVCEQNVDYVSQLPRCYAEIRCIIDFSKMRNKRGAEIMKWERQCKLQIAYTEDPVYTGEYIIWTIIYSDNNKCRRNLLAAFEAVTLEPENNQSSL